ncbi:MAG: BPL-N domain-containing protein [Singulisphaera sp.]
MTQVRPDFSVGRWHCVLCCALMALPSCAGSAPPPAASVLLFAGTGTSRNDVAAIATILKEHGFDYATANSPQMNAMSVDQLRAYRLIIIPGGNYVVMGDNLTAAAAERIRQAVQGGVNYLGICAGGLLAGKAKGNSLNLTDGVGFDFYSVVNRNIHKAAVPLTSVDGTVIDHYWEDGPQFTGWGAVVAKYPDDTPAIVEGSCGKGWVILCGVHPEAPENWRRGLSFTTPASTAHEYARALIDAALHGKRLPHF